MFRDKIANTKTPSETAARLKKVMLEYHDFRVKTQDCSLGKELVLLKDWQSQRLKSTHKDLYLAPEHSRGLQFLLSDLYSTEDFSDRDRDLERIFPKMIKLLPNSIIDTVGQLVELNLLTQELDYGLAHAIFAQLKFQHVDEDSYCEGYRHCNNYAQRSEQIALIAEVGKKLDRYARSSVVNFSLKISETPAEMAGLSALHSFIMQGFSAFYSMRNIDQLMQTLVRRETKILDNIFQQHPRPFVLGAEW